MNKYNPNIHHRKTIRLKGYDYSQVGLYFITICVHNRACMFGEIINGKMILNDAGIMVEKWYHELENKFSDIRCHEMIVMPNHFHCIVENVGTHVGADLRVCPNNPVSDNPDSVLTQTDKPDSVLTQTDKPDSVLTQTDKPGSVLTQTDKPGSVLTQTDKPGSVLTQTDKPGSDNIEGEHTGSPLHRVVQWFKTMVTNEYIRGVKTLGWQPFNGKLWQRNYWEHIIRNEKSYQTISEYIKNNPAKWNDDKFYKI